MSASTLRGTGAFSQRNERWGHWHAAAEDECHSTMACEVVRLARGIEIRWPFPLYNRLADGDFVVNSAWARGARFQGNVVLKIFPARD